MRKCANPRCLGHADNDPSIGQSPDHPVEVSGGLILFYGSLVIVFVIILIRVGL